MYSDIIKFLKLLYGCESNVDLGQRLLYTGWIYLGVVFVQSQFFPAPYGKFDSPTNVSILEKLRKFKLPAKISWIIMEVPSFVVSLLAIVHLYQMDQHSKILFLLPFSIHYFNRSLIYPLSVKNGKEFPIISSGSAFLFTFFNGIFQSHYIVSLMEVSRINALISSCGIVLFVAGMLINIQSDKILQSLRKGSETGYKIPREGFFSYVTCPHYFGECLEWLGYHLQVQSSASLWFACFSWVFLGSRAMATHQWYKEKFKEEYPCDRKAFIPLIL